MDIQSLIVTNLDKRKNHWGSRLLAGLAVKGKPKKTSPGQTTLPWAQWEVPDAEIREVAARFVIANCYNRQFAGLQFSPIPTPDTVPGISRARTSMSR